VSDGAAVRRGRGPLRDHLDRCRPRGNGVASGLGQWRVRGRGRLPVRDAMRWRQPGRMGSHLNGPDRPDGLESRPLGPSNPRDRASDRVVRVLDPMRRFLRQRSRVQYNKSHGCWWRLASNGARAGPVWPYSLMLRVSCTASDVCAAASEWSGVIWASAPPGPSGRQMWRRVAVDGGVTAGYGVISIACVSGQLCVAADASGHVLSANAIARPGAWRRQSIGQIEQSR